MSALGQKQTSRPEISMSALPPKADIVQHGGNVRFVPKADIANAIRPLRQRATMLAPGFRWAPPA